MRVERFVAPPGSWLPEGAALSERGERFLRSLRGRLVAVAALRCEGQSARAKLFCRALAKLAGGKVRPTVVQRGGATNRRVIVTVRHRLRRLP